jgi:hypothetical protein
MQTLFAVSMQAADREIRMAQAGAKSIRSAIRSETQFVSVGIRAPCRPDDRQNAKTVTVLKIYNGKINLGILN